MKKMITLKNISQIYNNRIVVNDVSFTIGEGEFVGVVGHSGSGKSTLLRIIYGEKPSKGSVEVMGKELSLSKHRELLHFRSENFGIVNQSDNLIGTLTAKENILLPAYLRKTSQDISFRFNYLVQTLSLTKIINKYADTLSGGEQQRVALARAMFFRPPIILLDEPTESLDRNNKRIIMDILYNLNKVYHVTIVMVTHGEVSFDVFDKVVCLEEGKTIGVVGATNQAIY